MKIIKIIFASLATVFIIGAVVFFSGPRVDLNESIHPLALPDNLDGLDNYIADSEARFSDITPGAEKSIQWFGEVGVKTPYSVVYLHGFSATRQETTPLTQWVARDLGANVFETRFAGHGRSNDAMVDGSVNAWVNDTHEAFEIGKKLGDKVIVIGVSTGATAATWLAEQSPEALAGIILISPNFAPRDSRSAFLTWPWGGHIAEKVIGPQRSWKPHNELHAKYWTYQYPTQAVLPMMGLVKLANQADLESVSVPLLVVYSNNDQVISTAAVETAFARFGSSVKEKIIYDDSEDPSQHVLAGDILSPNSTRTLTDVIVQFVSRSNK